MADQPGPKRRKVAHALPSPMTNGTTEASTTAQQRWQDAKAKGTASTGHTQNQAASREMDVYDDIEGAHGGRSSLKPTSTPVKSRTKLDPLRNQRAEPSPGKSSGHKVSFTGFFKQFHSPNLKKSLFGDPQGTVAPQGDVDGELHDAVHDSKLSSVSGRGEEPHDDDDDDQNMSDDNTPVRSSGRERKKPARYDEEAARMPKTKVAPGRGRKPGTGNAKPALKDMLMERRLELVNGQLENEPPKKRPRGRPRKHPLEAPKVVESRDEVERSDARREIPTDGIGKEIAEIDGINDPMEIDESFEEEPEQETSAVEAISATVTVSARAEKPPRATSSLEDVMLAPDQLHKIQDLLIQRLTGKQPIPLANLHDEYNKVSSLITQTITAGESNSMLIIGARGSGKTTLINQIIHEQLSSRAAEFHIIRLNGFIHTDDKIALREIWRQLGREMEVEDDTSSSSNKNLADTLTTLLALLSHPAEQGREQESGQITKSVIFVLDEFELFASHPRQTLLYNLFDIAQSRKAPIAVLGLTTRIDVAEALEKRVKSRFSHRYVHLGLAKSFTAFQDACRGALTFSTMEDDNTLAEPWNVVVDQLLADDGFTSHLHRIYYTTKSLPEVLTSLLIPASTIATQKSMASSTLVHHFTSHLSSLRPPDSKLTLLSSLSTLHLALLICAARLTNIHGADTVSFGQAYEEYKLLASKAKIQASASGALAQGAAGRVWGKDAARGAWQDLEQSGLVIPDSGSAGGKGRVDVGLEEIGLCGVDLGAWGRWCKEI